jgi:hypothetical protein
MRRPIAAGIVVSVTACIIMLVGARTLGATAPKPTPTPTPVAIGYDEITRTVMSPATPPPPGTFQPDYQLAVQSAGGAETAQSDQSATPTPAPQRHGLGAIMGAVSNPMSMVNPGSNQGEASAGGPQSNPYAAQMNAMNQMRNGHDVRYTWYWMKNWVREDDPVAQTAVIHKCPQHQDIRLDLRKKTYQIIDTTTGQVEQPSGSASSEGGRSMGRAMGPGTVDMTVKNTAQNLGPKTLEGVPTQGYRTTFAMTMSNATGSCSNGEFGMLRVSYISGIGKPRPYCPLALAHAAPGPMGGGTASGGCKPTFHGSSTGSNPMADSDKLEMYDLRQFNGGQMGGQAPSLLTERGNVDWYLRPQAETLFAPPPDFTQVGG